VDEEAPDGSKEQDDHEDHARAAAQWCCQTQDIERHEAAEPREDHVDRVGSRVHQPVDMLRAVMDGVELPQQRHLVAPAVAPEKPISPMTKAATTRSHVGQCVSAMPMLSGRRA
jgi:hypothetical protein